MHIQASLLLHNAQTLCFSHSTLPYSQRVVALDAAGVHRAAECLLLPAICRSF